ncbi:MAG: hypothetical protein ACJ74W_05345 [Pyrinomonadaceae bacterium]
MSLRLRLRASAFASGLLCAAAVCAQTPAGGGAAANKPRGNKPVVGTRTAAVDPLAETRRANAISLINALADEARGFHDAALRARVQARAADALWALDQERAKSLFRRAWDAAEVADREAQHKEDEERDRQIKQNNGTVILSGSPRVRPEILRLAAKRDRALGEELLTKLDEARKQEADVAQTETPKATDDDAPDRNQLSSAMTHRLELARQLLESGDVEQAKQFALPALARISIPGLQFLVGLRAYAPTDADQLYRSLLTGVVADPTADANTVSQLSSYLFSPSLFVSVSRTGGWSSQGWQAKPATAEIPAELRAAFFNVGAQVLLRPLPPPDQDHSTAGRVGTYAIIARLLPLFEQYGSDKAPLLRTQLAALTPDAPESWRTGRESMLTEGLRSGNDSGRDPVQDALDRLKTASTPDARDQAYIAAVFAAQRKQDFARARDLTDKISDPDARRQLRSYLDYVGVMRASEKKDAPELLRLAADGDLTHVQRVYAYTQAARLLAKDDRGRALETLDMAGQEAQRIDAADPDRARAMLSVLTEIYDLDHTRAWEQLPDLVKIVNALDNFSGEDGKLVGMFRAKGWGSVNSTSSDSFDLTGIFSKIAREDMDRAIEFARAFNGESPRAVATLAIARAVLEKKDKDKAVTSDK